LPLPKYSITDRAGPDHALVFTITVACGEHQASAEGTSRRGAEQRAAEVWLKEFK
jgi:ribonuclease-3